MFKGFNRYNFSKQSFQDFIKNDTLVSNGDPLSVGTPIRWYDASRIDPAGVDWNTMLVSSWNDLMGNDNFVQGTLANKPVYNPLGINNKPSISFFNTDVLQTNNVISLYNSNHTAYMVVKRISATQIVSGLTTMTNRGIRFYAGTVNPYGGGTAIYQEPCPTPPSSYILRLRAELNYGLNIYVNGKVSKQPYTFTGIDTDSPLRLTGSLDNELYSEIIVFNSLHNSTEANIIENYLKFKWGIL